jgi:hypothetical protein
MSNRFNIIPQAEYIPQFVPDALDPKMFMEVVAGNQNRYDTAVAAFTDMPLESEYLDSVQEDAQKILGDYKNKRDTIVNKLLVDKDVSGASKQISQLTRDFNASKTHGDLRNLQKQVDDHKKNLEYINTVKDDTTRSMIMERYNSTLPKTLKNETGQYNSVGTPKIGSLPDYETAILKAASIINSDGYTTEDGKKYKPVVVEGQTIGFSADGTQVEMIGLDKAIGTLKGMLENDPQLKVNGEFMNWLYDDEKMHDRMLENAIRGGARGIAYTKTKESPNFIPLSTSSKRSSGTDEDGNPVLPVNLTQVQAVIENNAVTSPEELEERLAIYKEGIKLTDNDTADFNKVLEVHNKLGTVDAVATDTMYFSEKEDGFLTIVPEEFFVNDEDLRGYSAEERQKVLDAQQRIAAKNHMALNYNAEKNKKETLKRQAYANANISQNEIDSKIHLDNLGRVVSSENIKEEVEKLGITSKEGLDQYLKNKDIAIDNALSTIPNIDKAKVFADLKTYRQSINTLQREILNHEKALETLTEEQKKKYNNSTLYELDASKTNYENNKKQLVIEQERVQSYLNNLYSDKVIGIQKQELADRNYEKALKAQYSYYTDNMEVYNRRSGKPVKGNDTYNNLISLEADYANSIEKDSVSLVTTLQGSEKIYNLNNGKDLTVSFQSPDSNLTLGINKENKSLIVNDKVKGRYLGYVHHAELGQGTVVEITQALDNGTSETYKIFVKNSASYKLNSLEDVVRGTFSIAEGDDVGKKDGIKVQVEKTINNLLKSSSTNKIENYYIGNDRFGVGLYLSLTPHSVGNDPINRYKMSAVVSFKETRMVNGKRVTTPVLDKEGNPKQHSVPYADIRPIVDDITEVIYSNN